MKRLFYLLVFFFPASCKNEGADNANRKEEVWSKDTIDYRKQVDDWYDIADLEHYTDQSKFIARLRYEPPFKRTTVIELDEIGNGIHLCVKQPQVILPEGGTLKGSRSLAFNQLCYWYADNETGAIKALFDKFNTGEVVQVDSCYLCLDETYWQVEVFDHGKYSSFRKDEISNDDWKLIEALLQKVKLDKKNDYAIRY